MKEMKTLTLTIAAAAGLSGAACADIVDDFEKHASALPSWSEEAKAALSGDGDAKDKISTALKTLYPKLGPALQSAGENPAGLLELSQSEDPFLAAESSYFLARELMKRQQYEKALPLMRNVNEKLAEKSPRALDSLYYQGIAENELLMRGDAITSLSAFVEATEEGSRLRDAAFDMLGELQLRGEGSIGDVADHMEFSERRLGREDPGEKTQEVQNRIVDMLEELIKQAEEQEQQQQQQQQQSGSSSSQSQGSKPSNGEGQNAGGNSSAQKIPKVVRRVRGSTKSAWDDLRQKDRNADALSALKSKYPPRYQQLIEQYYRDLNESANGEEEEDQPEPVN